MDAIETLKSLGKAALAIGNLEQKAAILELVNEAQTNVFELRQKTFEMQAEIEDLKRQLADQKRQDDLITGLKHERNVYWKEGKPYCVGCANDRGKLIPIAHMGGRSKTGYCPSCETKYANVFGDDPPPQAPEVVRQTRRWKPEDYL